MHFGGAHFTQHKDSIQKHFALLAFCFKTDRENNQHTHTHTGGNTAMFRLCQPTHKEEQTLVFTDGSTAAQEAEEKEHASHTKDDVDTGE